MRWNDWEKEFILDNYNKYSYEEMGKILGRSEKAISNKLLRLGVRKRPNCRFWSEDEINVLLQCYIDEVPPIKIANLLNRSYNSVILKAESLGLKRKEYYRVESYNTDFFTELTDELAWLIGIVMSDGYISNPKFGKFIRVAMCDADVVFNIAKLIDYKNEVIKKVNDNGKDVFIINIHGKFVWDFFMNLGVTFEKSHRLCFPELPYRYIYHCIRGIFDGDGSISINYKTMYPCVRIIAVKSIIDFISEFIDLHFNLYRYNEYIYTLQYTGERAIVFLNTLYKNSKSINRMKRKYNLYKTLLEAKRWRNFMLDTV